MDRRIEELNRSFEEAMAVIEAILLDDDSTHADYVVANDLAALINEMD